MIERNLKRLPTYGILLAVTLGVTIAVAAILVPEDDRTNIFYLTMVAIVFAECVTFVYPISLALREKSVSESIPYFYGTGIMILVYDGGVALLALLAFTAITFNPLLILHLVWVLIFTLGIGASTIGGIYIGGVEKAEKRALAPLIHFKNDFQALHNQLDMIAAADASPLKDAFRAFREELEFAASDSLPGSEEVEAQFARCLDTIRANVSELGTTARNQGPDPPEGDAPALSKLVAEAQSHVKRMTQLLQQREELMGQLR